VIIGGFQACGVHAGLKADNALDFALITADGPAAGAAIFTRNLVQAAPVVFDRALMKRAAGNIRAVVINSKNANACTGAQGDRDVARTAQLVRRALSLPEEAGVFVMSTGVIGVPLQMERIEEGIRKAVECARPEGLSDVARAIMTTDTRPKTAMATCGDVRLAGVAKGAGMIHPDMATMLSVILTDAALTPEVLTTVLGYAADRSFHCISVDGDTSTNDTLLVLASGLSGVAPPLEQFRDALTTVCMDLARQIAFDGEGASKHVTIHVKNAGSFDAARRVGRVVATSPLVKTALYGRDANWGRVLAAAGRAQVPFIPERASLHFGGLKVLEDGRPLPLDEARALEILSEQTISMHLDLGGEPGEATVWTCDFSHDYVTINGAYRT